MKTKLALVLGLCLATTSCAAVDSALSSESFTNPQAVAMMESMVKGHAALNGANVGSMRTICALEQADDTDPTETYACSTFLKDHMVVLHAECTEDGCTASGFDNVEMDDGK